MFCPVVFLVPTSTSSPKNNERSTIFIWKLSLDVALNTSGEWQTGNTNTSFDVVFLNPIKEITILLFDETLVKIVSYLDVSEPSICSDLSSFHIHECCFCQPKTIIQIIPAAALARCPIVTSSSDSFIDRVAFSRDTFDLCNWR